MRIAVIGWGSLIWDPRRLDERSRWHRNGPSLPVEFARKSRDGRLTLVLHSDANEQQTYWLLSGCDSLGNARENLRAREGTSTENIHDVSRGQSNDAASIAGRIQRWLALRPDLDAAIWTGLPPTPPFHSGKRAVEYLEQLRGETLTNARHYVVMTPPQIQTSVRAEMQRRGWADTPLSDDLFEP
jgi:hypothetical protein